MLTLTPTAEDVVKQLVADAPVDDATGGLRIAAGEPTPDGVPIELSLVDAPESLDVQAPTADGGTHVYVEPAVADALGDKVLDAEVQDGGVGFRILESPADPSPNGSGPA